MHIGTRSKLSVGRPSATRTRPRSSLWWICSSVPASHHTQGASRVSLDALLEVGPRAHAPDHRFVDDEVVTVGRVRGLLDGSSAPPPRTHDIREPALALPRRR